MEIRDKIFRNVSTSLLALIANVVVGLSLMPFIVRHIGLTGFGIWMLVNTLVGYMGLLDVGLGPALTRKSADLIAKNDEQLLNKTVSLFFVIYLLIGVVVGIATISLSIIAPYLFSVPADSIEDFRMVFWIVGLQVAVSFPMSIWASLLGGLQAHYIQHFISIITAVARAAGTVFLLLSGFGLISLVWLGLALTSIGWLIAMSSVKRRIPHLRVKTSRFRLGETEDIARFSAVVLVGSLSSKILFESARIVIGLFRPIALVTIYEAGLSICLYSRHIFYLAAVITSSAAYLHATDNKAGLRNIYLMGTKYLFAVYSAIVVALLLIGNEFIILWMGETFSESVLVMYVLLLGSLYQCQNVIAIYLLMGMNSLEALAKASVAHIIINVVLGVIFVIYWGLIGAAMATTITIVIVETYLLLKILRIFEMDLRYVLRICHMPALLPALAGTASIISTRQFIGLNTWMGIAIALLLFSAAWLVVFTFMGTTSQERMKIRDMASKQLSRNGIKTA